jgi:hypothetical protein
MLRYASNKKMVCQQRSELTKLQSNILGRECKNSHIFFENPLRIERFGV